VRRIVLVFFYLKVGRSSVPAAVLALEDEGAALVWEQPLIDERTGPQKTELLVLLSLIYSMSMDLEVEHNDLIDTYASVFRDLLKMRGIVELDVGRRHSGTRLAHSWLVKARSQRLFLSTR
jgi:hypothetical protein